MNQRVPNKNADLLKKNQLNGIRDQHYIALSVNSNLNSRSVMYTLPKKGTALF